MTVPEGLQRMLGSDGAFGLGSKLCLCNVLAEARASGRDTAETWQAASNCYSVRQASTRTTLVWDATSDITTGQHNNSNKYNA